MPEEQVLTQSPPRPGSLTFNEKLETGQALSYLSPVRDLLFLNILTSLLGEGSGPPLQCSCLENPTDGGAWWAAVHGVVKSRTRLSGFTFTFHFHALKKELATRSSVLAWRIPGTGEPGGLPPVGSQSRTQLKRLSSSSNTLTWSHGRLCKAPQVSPFYR